MSAERGSKLGSLQNRVHNARLVDQYASPVSELLRGKAFWFRGLGRKPGERFAVCGGNPAW